MVKVGKVFLFLGPQGSGKGTQAQRFAQKHGFTILCMGELLAKEQKKDTSRGQRIARLINTGELVPDEVTIQVLTEHLEKLPMGTTIILDGFPRTIQQARALERIVQVTTVIYITLPRDVALQRINGRRRCPNGHIFNIVTAPPMVANVCDVDGLPLSQRSDDTEQAVRRRLTLHEQEVSDVLPYYEKQGKLVMINGVVPISDVEREIEEKVRVT